MKTTLDIHQLIAGLSPETFCQPRLAKTVGRLLRRKLKETNSPHEAVLPAAAMAEPRPANLIPLERLEEMDLFDCPGLRSPRAQFTFARDAPGESLEAFYFSVLNQLEQLEGWQVFKLIDELHPTILSPLFADGFKQQSRIQQQVFAGLEAVHQLVHDILNSVEEVEQRTREQQREDSGEGTEHPTTTAPDLELLRARLRSQVTLLQLRAAAIRPWLRTASTGVSLPRPAPSLVNAFNTAEFQVVLLAVGPDVLPEAIESGRLPGWMQRKSQRRYHPVLLLEFRFRARPRHSRSHGHAYAGRVELTLTSYGLHGQEINVLQETVEAALLRDSLRLGIDEAQDTLHDLVRQVEKLMAPAPAPAPEPTPGESIHNLNPFTALFSLLKDLFRWITGRAPPEESRPTDLRPDNTPESVARSLAILAAAGDHEHLCRSLGLFHLRSG